MFLSLSMPYISSLNQPKVLTGFQRAQPIIDGFSADTCLTPRCIDDQLESVPHNAGED